MTKFEHLLKSRVGTCRSGNPFDVPHKFHKDMIESYLSSFSINDQVDIFCMCEAVAAQKTTNDISFEEQENIIDLGRYLWREEIFLNLSPHLKALGLTRSPHYVRFGQNRLLLHIF